MRIDFRQERNINEDWEIRQNPHRRSNGGGLPRIHRRMRPGIVIIEIQREFRAGQHRRQQGEG